MSRNLSMVIIGLLLSTYLLFYSLEGIKFEDFWKQINRFSVKWLPALIATLVAVNFIRGLRWRYLLGPTGRRASLNSAVKAAWLGTTANLIFPLRAGEFIRPWIYTREVKTTYTRTFVSVAVERVLDIVVILILFGIFLGFYDLPENLPKELEAGIRALGICAGISLVVIMLAFLYGEKLSLLVEKVSLSILPTYIAKKISHLVSEVVSGIIAIESWKSFLISIILSFVLWILMSAFYYFGLLSLGEEAGFSVAVTTMSILAIAVAVPSGPGFIGTFQFGCVLSLNNIYGYPKEVAFAWSVLMHVLQILIQVVGSLPFLNLWDLNLSKNNSGEADSKGACRSVAQQGEDL